MAPTREVRAAGAVVLRKGEEVLLVHRPRYDDWSFPKGKVDRGEHITTAAVREVGEETGLHVRLGVPLGNQRYPVKVGMKTVHYWVGRVVTHDDVSGYEVNHEIDDVRWVPVEKSWKKLTYDYDRVTLTEAMSRRRKTHALVVLRHSKSRSRKAWRRDDRLRPLLAIGMRQTRRLSPVLAAYDVTSIASSSSVRCVQSVAPYAEASGWTLMAYDGLSEEGATDASVLEVVDELLHRGESSVLCTHRPVLPTVFDALGLPEVKLEPGAMVVVHHRQGSVVATEGYSI
jgi:8-oxo-dGTP diphosphatase